MTNEQTMTLVLKDSAGNYFLVPQETLERGRVPEEHKAEVERLMEEADYDTNGHAALAAGIALGIAAVTVGFLVTKTIKDELESDGPGWIDIVEQLSGR